MQDSLHSLEQRWRGEDSAYLEDRLGQLNTLRSRDNEMPAALAAKRVLCRGIFHLLEAAMWTFHTDF
jgi:hypothetical protein